MENSKVNRSVSIIAFILISILLFAAREYLLKTHIHSGFSLLIFGIFFLVGFIRIKESSYIYPFVLLFSCSYYLLLYFFGMKVIHAPLLSVPIVFVLYFVGKRVKTFSTSFNLCAYFVTVIFFLYIARGILNYIRGDTWLVIVPVMLFSLFYFLRSRDLRKPFQLYVSLILFSFGFLLILYGIRVLPLPYYGPLLVVLCVAMMAIGSKYHSRIRFELVRVFYIIGLLLSFSAFIYASRDSSVLLLILLLFSLHYFGIGHKLILKPTSGRPQEMIFYKAFLGLGTIGGFACVVLLFLFRFPIGYVSLISLLGFSLLFLFGGWKCKGSISRMKRPYIYLFGFFVTSFYLMLLARINPAGSVHLNMLFSPVLLLIFLVLGLSMVKRKQIITGIYIFEASYSIVIASFVLPLILKDYSAFSSSILCIAFLILFLLFALLSKQRMLFYASALLLPFLYFNLLRILPINDIYFPLFFIPLGFLSWILSILLHKRKPFWAAIFFLAFFTVSWLSILSGLPQGIINVYSFSIWGVLYLLGSQLLTRRIGYA